VLANSIAMKKISDMKPNLVVGGPPCQGFSLAGRRNRDDSRNDLPWDFIDFVSIARPSLVVMENVVGMSHKFSSEDENSAFDALALALASPGGGVKYRVQKVLANALHYGAAQSRPRLFLIACEEKLAEQLGLHITQSLWKSNFSDLLLESIPDLAPRPAHSSESATVGDAVLDLVANRGQSKYVKKVNSNGVPVLTNQKSELLNFVKRKHSFETEMKFRVFQILKDQGLPQILIKNPRTKAEAIKRESALLGLNQIQFPVSSPDKKLVVPSQAAFAALLGKYQTSKHSQRVMSLKDPAPTIVTAADDYIHPLEPRALTVRELARFQGFPDNFEFRSKETTGGLKRRVEVPQYTQVGNAVSPFVSRAIGQRLSEILLQRR
jgi:DNA (cytosine-5)-methyltransferase 1